MIHTFHKNILFPLASGILLLAGVWWLMLQTESHYPGSDAALLQQKIPPEESLVLQIPSGTQKLDGQSLRKATATEQTSASFSHPQESNRVAYSMEVLAVGLNLPGGIAVQPKSGTVFITEEYASRITRLDANGLELVADRQTPVFRMTPHGREAAKPLEQPEGLAFAPDGSLYVVEDAIGGRIIRFILDADGSTHAGEVIDLPGNWDGFSWEDIAIGPKYEILLVGGNADQLVVQQRPGIFRGVLLYRDADGAWWMPYDRMFASFSSVEFSQSGRQAVYACEYSGELGWIDLSVTRRLGGSASRPPPSLEGLCVIPDGSFVVGEENGTLHAYDPGLDVLTKLNLTVPSVESMVWDPVHHRILVTDDAEGRLLALIPARQPDPRIDRMVLAAYQPVVSQMHIPYECPEFIARVLELGGLSYRSELPPPVDFPEFTARVPLIAADTAARPVAGLNHAEDPIEQVQFVVFEPNKIETPNETLETSLAGFYARTRSGKVIHTTTRKMTAHKLGLDEAISLPLGITDVVVPYASAITVSATGIATLQFMGLDTTPDFSLVINPRVPDESYMVVFHADGTRDHYQLRLPPHTPDVNNWVVAYADRVEDNWKSLEFLVP